MIVNTSQLNQTLDLLRSNVSNDTDLIDIVDQCMYQVSVLLQYRQLKQVSLNIKTVYNKYISDSLDLFLYGYDNKFTGLKDLIRHVSEQGSQPNYFQQIITHLNQLGSDLAVTRLESLVQKFSDIITDSESHLVMFLNKTTNTELRQLPNIQLQLEESHILLDETSLQELARHINISPSSTTEETYRGFNQKLGFETNDSNFTNLFYIFVQIINYKVGPSPIERDFTPAIRLMLDVYKAQCQINWIELNDPELIQTKIALLRDFFLHWSDHVTKICSNIISSYVFFPEDNTDFNDFPNHHEPPAIPPEYPANDVNSSLNELDQQILLNNLAKITPQLSGFTFDFDPLFSKALALYIPLVNDGVQEDLDYLNDLILLVNMLVEFENDERPHDGDKIYGTAYSLYSLHKLLSPDNGISGNQTLLMRYCVFVINRDFETMKTILKSWNLRVLSISQIEYNLESWKAYSSNSLQANIFHLWHKDYNRNLRLYNGAEIYDNKRTMAKILISKWLSRSQRISKMNHQSEHFMKNRILMKWKAKILKVQDLEKSALDYDKNARLRMSLIFWKSKFQYVINQSQLGDNFHNQCMDNKNKILLRFIFKEWHTQTYDEGVLNNLKTLSLKEESLQLRRYFNTMKTQYSYSVSVNQVRSHSEQTLMKFFFSKWKRMYKLGAMSNSFQENSHEHIKSNLMLNWYHMTQSVRTADELYRTKLIPRIFKQWKLKARSNHKEVLQIDPYFQKWQLALKSAQLSRKFDKTLLVYIFDKWANHRTNYEQKEALALQVSSNNRMKVWFKVWNKQVEFQTALPEIADTFFQKKFMDKMNKQFKYNHQLRQLGAEFHKQSSFNDTLTIKSIMNLWKQQREYKFQVYNEPKVYYFNERVLVPNLKRKIFVDWIMAYNRTKAYEKEMDLKCQQFVIRSKVKRYFLKKWVSKLRTVGRMHQVSHSFQQKVLYKKYMVIWYDKYLNKAQHLEEICQELIDQKELRRQSEILSDWSMKYIKVITRHHQSCELFIKRWESSRLKSLFDLWNYKYKLKQVNESFYDTSTDSIFNDSPLAIRKKPKSNDDDINPDESYLNSPIKSQSLPPNTPMINNISPTRIQTSIRMKNERIQALKQHYSKIKGVKIKPKQEPFTFLNSIIPPERPNFVPIAEPVKMEETSPIPPAPPIHTRSHSEFTDTPIGKNDIDTAKKLRRITPIFIPDSGDNEPKLSPVQTIKQRHSESYFSR